MQFQTKMYEMVRGMKIDLVVQLQLCTGSITFIYPATKRMEESSILNRHMCCL